MSTPIEFCDKYSDEYGYDGYGDGYTGSGREPGDGYSTREVSTETSGADGEAGAGMNGGAGGMGGGNTAGRADARYYTGRRYSPSVRMFRQVMEIYWLVVTVIYFAVSFLSGRWGISWLIWLIGAAVDRAIRILWDTHRFDGPSDKR